MDVLERVEERLGVGVAGQARDDLARLRVHEERRRRRGHAEAAGEPGGREAEVEEVDRVAVLDVEPRDLEVLGEVGLDGVVGVDVPVELGAPAAPLREAVQQERLLLGLGLGDGRLDGRPVRRIVRDDRRVDALGVRAGGESARGDEEGEGERDAHDVSGVVWRESTGRRPRLWRGSRETRLWRK